MNIMNTGNGKKGSGIWGKRHWRNVREPRIYACSDRKEAGPGSHAIHWKMEAWQRDGILPEKNNKLTLEHFANALRFREEQKKEM